MSVKRYPVDWHRRWVGEHRHVQRLLARRRLQAHHTAQDPLLSLVRSFLCIHAGEGSWTDPDAPYWGGLQFDANFQATYAPTVLLRLGTADHWPPAAQLAVALIAYSTGRGFFPWPNTARNCGLL